MGLDNGALREHIALAPPSPSRWIAPLVGIGLTAGLLSYVFLHIPHLRREASTAYSGISVETLYAGTVGIDQINSRLLEAEEEVNRQIAEQMERWRIEAEEQAEAEAQDRIREAGAAVSKEQDPQRFHLIVASFYQEIASNVYDQRSHFVTTKCRYQPNRTDRAPSRSECRENVRAELVADLIGFLDQVRMLEDDLAELGVPERERQALVNKVVSTPLFDPFYLFSREDFDDRFNPFTRKGYVTRTRTSDGSSPTQCFTAVREIISTVSISEQQKHIACTYLNYVYAEVTAAERAWLSTPIPIDTSRLSNDVKVSLSEQLGDIGAYVERFGEDDIPDEVRDLGLACKGRFRGSADDLDPSDTAILVRHPSFIGCRQGNLAGTEQAIQLEVLAVPRASVTRVNDTIERKDDGTTRVSASFDYIHLSPPKWCRRAQLYFAIENISRQLISLGPLGVEDRPPYLCPNIIQEEADITLPLDLETRVWVPLRGITFAAIVLFIGGIVTFVVGLVLSLTDTLSRRRINRLFASGVQGKAFGLDDPAFVVAAVSANPLFAPAGMQWTHLPETLANAISERADEAVRKSIPAMREQLTRHLREGTFVAEGIKQLMSQLTWEELVHTAYFRTPEFRDFLAHVVTDTDGVSRARTFTDRAQASQSEDWLTEISPGAKEPNARSDGKYMQRRAPTRGGVKL